MFHIFFSLIGLMIISNFLKSHNFYIKILI